MVNTVLASAMAHSFREFSAKIDAGAAPAAVAQEALNKHWKVCAVFWYARMLAY